MQPGKYRRPPPTTLLSQKPLGVEFKDDLPMEFRQAKVWVPDSWKVPDEIDIKITPGDMPDPHFYKGRDVWSWRTHPRSHHRVLILRNNQHAKQTYSLRTVGIRTQQRRFTPYVTHWYNTPEGWLLVHHFNPHAKVDKWANQKMRDVKHKNRSEPDDSRADALRLIRHTDPNLPHLRRALEYADGPSWQKDRSGVLLDTALFIQSQEGINHGS